ncbi:patatin-like phospholipase family protein [Ramlibacter albus]|uniref:Patatin-like phospholipase family protein n=1 Tax=Ramlibacter albus TaxID=2079448 RepID=A0A923MA52_9BURK|nr:patatin-like phospholipase family protein [Ramlibacter albus]MBC5766638.1 patatin-like phospholipase family protein [Ramlibacter albus]
MKAVNLALQGGGSHGAFTWGVLDALLEDGSFEFPAISGTSAGAVNAVALASGWAVAVRAGRSPREGAREALRAVWNEVASLGTYGSMQREMLRVMFGAALPLAAGARSQLAFNPLRGLLERTVDFGALHDADAPKVHVGATHVRTGRAAVFSGARLTLDAVLASACLPELFAPVTIGGELYWDGGYSVNPPLAPFLHQPAGGDVLLIQINPVLQAAAPVTSSEIRERAAELTFNAGLLSQVRAVEHFNQLVGLGILPRERLLRLHRIDGGDALQRFSQSTRATADPVLVRELFTLGRETAAQWLRIHANAVGHRGTLPFREYADDTWLTFRESTRPWRVGARIHALLRAATRVLG